MNKAKLQLFLSLALAIISSSLAYGQQVFKVTPQATGYLEYLPPDYNSNSNKYPVLIFLHGMGERGPNSTNFNTLQSGSSMLTKHGPPRHIKNGYKFPFIVISPQLKNNYGRWPATYVDEVVEHVRTYLRIDPARIYVTGLSLGGGGAWEYAETYAHKIAAVAPICAGYNNPSKACNIASNKLPVWTFHGDKDNIVNMSKTVNMVNAIKACSPAPNPAPLLTIYPGVDHNSWDRAYRTDNSLHSPNLYDWMMSKSKGGSSSGGNATPNANAGPDKNITLPTNSVVLNGSGSDSDGSISSYTWTKVSGGSASLNGASTPNLNASGLGQGNYVFRLTVKDNKGASKSDDVNVKVSASSSSGNTPPTANAGTDVTTNNTTVTLNGSASDSDGSIAKWEWKKMSGPPAWMGSPNTKTLTASQLHKGTYVFRLTVTDNKGATSYDEATVVIGGSTNTGNAAPTVSAGSDRTLSGTSVTLNGSASDQDGSIVKWEWRKMSGPPAWMTNPNTNTLTASQLHVGTYIFRLTVKDNKGATSYDEVKVVIQNTTASNAPPNVNAGPDKSTSGTSITLYGSASDPDGSIVKWDWRKISGPPAWMTNPKTKTLTASQLQEGTYTFRLTVADNKGVTRYDDTKVVVN